MIDTYTMRSDNLAKLWMDVATYCNNNRITRDDLLAELKYVE